MSVARFPLQIQVVYLKDMPVVEKDEWLPRTTSTYYVLRNNCRVEADENCGVGGGVFLPFRASASFLYETLFIPLFFNRQCGNYRS